MHFILKINLVLNPCSSNPCQNGGICSPNLNTQTYTCTCLSGFTGTNCNIGNESWLLNELKLKNGLVWINFFKI
jgi:hypothetical protein